MRAHREIERQNMNKALIDYLNFYLSPNGGSVPSSVSSPAYEQLLVFDQLFLRFSRSHYEKTVLRPRFIGHKNAAYGPFGHKTRPKTCDYRPGRSKAALF